MLTIQTRVNYRHPLHVLRMQLIDPLLEVWEVLVV